ncbi:MAG: HlyD family secretion protein, partial [Caulobacteraceae bacterium]|nr:HlyD family secretion protein [Caulobacteraceae bacterium]
MLPPSEPAPVARRPTGRLRRLRWPIMVGAVVLVAAAGLYVYLTGGRYESTDDAQIQSARVSVSGSISGRVVSVRVREGQFVKAGEVLYQLDARPFEAAYDEATANLEANRLQVEGLKAAYRQHEADLKSAEDNLTYLRAEAKRQKALVSAGTATEVQAAQLANQAEQASHTVDAQREALANALAALGGKPDIPVDQHPLVLQSKARLTSASLNKGYVDVVAQQDGIVTKVDQLQAGNYVNASTPVFSLVAPRGWIEANFKENQLEYMRAGQAATIKVDAYPDRIFKARLVSISPGTGSSFSLLPPENATGNWVKVTQRVPVRLEFDGDPGAPMPAGLSVSVKVDTTHHRHLFGSPEAAGAA